MKKLFTILISATLVTGIASAVDVELTPGQQNNVTSNTSNLQSQSTDLPLTFKTENSTLYATPPEGYPSTTGQITLEYSNTTQNLSAKIIEYSNWDSQVKEIEDNVSVGDTGRLAVINLTQKGNTQTRINANATGNLTKYISYDDRFQLYPQNSIRKSVSYNIPRDTEFGYYNASITFTEETTSENQTLQLSTKFKDDISPEITSTSFPDVMSTKTGEFQVQISENYGVDSVTLDVERQAEEERENRTVLVNKTVGSYNFSRNGQVYRLKFNDTENIGKYFYKLNVTDKAGNTVSEKGSFSVEGLDAVSFAETNFELPSVYPKDTESILDETTTKAEKEIFEVEKETDVTVSLNDFQHSNENSSISVGVLKPGDDVSEKFDLEDGSDSITVSEPGSYSIVVESDKVESYSGTVEVELVEQHVGENPRTIQFEGIVNNPEYPPEQEWSLRGFNASLEYFDSDGDGEVDTMRQVLEADSETCKGYSSAEECPEIKDWQNIVDSVKKENEDFKSAKNSALIQRNLAILVSFGVLVGYIRNKNLSGRHLAVQPVKQ